MTTDKITAKVRRGCRVVTASISAQLLLRDQLAALSDIRWTVVTGDDYPDPPDGFDVKVIPIRREFALSDGKSISELYRYFRSQRFDFVQTHTPKASFLGLPAARVTRTPSIYTIHGALYFVGNSRRANFLGWFFERWCCAWANRVALQSAEDLSALPKVGICRKSKLTHIGNGIVLDRFVAPVPPALTSDKPIVLMVSRLVAEKGCLDYFELAAALADRATFVHVGPIEHDQNDAIQPAQIAQLEKSGTVQFIGEVSDVRPYLAAADLVVLPSYREGIPRAAMEAAASGRAVAAYDIRGVREVVDPDTGLLTTRGDVKELVSNVGRLLRDPEHLRELGRHCQEWVVSRFSEDLVVDRLKALYEEMEAKR